MSFATNTNYVAPVVAPDLGNPTKVVPPNLANGFVPGQPIAAEHVNYCVSRLCPQKDIYTANTTWTKPPHAKWVRIVCVGGGGKGVNGTASQGGKGGDGGEVVDMTFDANELASTLAVFVGAGSTSSSAGGGATYVQNVGNTIMVALGGSTGSFGGVGAPSDVVTNVSATTLGGEGGAADVGLRGNHSRFGPGGAGGAVNVVGGPGLGYGAGGGGGRQSSGSNSGGGGGGGGYGTSQYAALASGSTGGNGAVGVVYFFTTCDI